MSRVIHESGDVRSEAFSPTTEMQWVPGTLDGQVVFRTERIATVNGQVFGRAAEPALIVPFADALPRQYPVQLAGPATFTLADDLVVALPDGSSVTLPAGTALPLPAGTAGDVPGTLAMGIVRAAFDLFYTARAEAEAAAAEVAAEPAAEPQALPNPDTTTETAP